MNVGSSQDSPLKHHDASPLLTTRGVDSLPASNGNSSKRRSFWDKSSVVTERKNEIKSRGLVSSFENDLNYWKEQLRSPSPVQLPTDLSRSSRSTGARDTFDFRISADACNGLRALGSELSTPISHVLLAAFEALLFRYTEQADMILVADLSTPQILRTALSPEMTFRASVEHVSERLKEASLHQLPFDRLLEILREAAGGETSQFLSVKFCYTGEFPKTEGENISAEVELRVSNVDDEMTCTIVFDAHLFQRETISRFADHFCNLISDATRNGPCPISSLAILSEEERTRILMDWNQTDGPYPNVCVHELFEQQVARTPESVAVEYRETSWTFRELNVRADRLSRTLRSYGVNAETLVGLSLHRSAEMVVAMLAILKAGAAYVPLDPSMPAERLSFMVEDSKMLILLTETSLLDLIPTKNVHKLCIDKLPDQRGINSDSRKPRPQDLAYVLYTSGSTGKPKGVQIAHYSVVNFLQSMQREPGLTANDRLLAITTLSFDIAGLEIFLPLITGARVVVAPRETTVDGVALAKLIEQSQITVMQGTPATWRLLLQTGWKGCERLRVLCGGEALPTELAAGLLPRCRELWNLYGPTETTIWSSAIRIQSADEVVVGPPIANTQFYIVDSLMQPVPVGVCGELCIGGDGLARGYLNRPELTAEKFISNPFKPTGKARVYRTGDLARFRRDGCIEFLGRKDHQVKVRGFRVELGEIETVLGRHAAISENVVVARECSEEEKQLVAYFVAKQEVSVSELRRFVADQLPDYMVPAMFMELEQLPLTPNGKIDRRALPEPRISDEREECTASPCNDIERQIGQIWRDVLKRDHVGTQENFFDIGGHSLLLAKIHAKLQNSFPVQLSMIELFEYPTIAKISEVISSRLAEQSAKSPASAKEAENTREQKVDDDRIAIIGMAGRFPGAANIREFWSNLQNGVESIFPLSDDELRTRGITDDLLSNPNYVKAGTDLEAYDRFDAAFFGINPREAELIDPQQRVLLETAWEALEDAGVVPQSFDGRVGVFAGAAMTDYATRADGGGAVDSFQAMLGSDKDFLATRISYKLNLRGPGLTIQTACSTSLVAVHVACRSLLNGECEMALAGGVAASHSPRVGYLHEEGMILSPDGHCRAFDADGAGTVLGMGAGIVVLKRLSGALKDGDSVYAVIRGTAINNDGGEKIGYTAPSIAGQAEVIRLAQAAAGINPETISYVEAHGTGTPLGDPIEITALTQAFRETTSAKRFCALGSVKTNIGHLDVAAGIAGLIKAVLSLKNKQIPPSLHFKRPNPKIDFENSPFYVNAALKDWNTTDSIPRRAAVSSFGIGGTNAHVILEEAPSLKPAETSRSHQLLLVSARNENTLRTASEKLSGHLAKCSDSELADFAYTLQVGRKHFSHRTFSVVNNRLQGVESLKQISFTVASEELKNRPVVFLFPGQGSQHPRMGADLYQQEIVFREHVDRCSELLEPYIGCDIRSLLFSSDLASSRQLNETQFAQPTLFVIEYSLAQLWMHWGVKPSAMLGHSLGEYVAACIAGVLDVKDAVGLVAERGRLMQRLPQGAMIAVPLDEREIQPYLSGQICHAASNGPRLNVLSGPMLGIERVVEELGRNGITSKRLHTSHAFHSSMMDPILSEFADRVSSIKLHKPSTPYVSNLTGQWITNSEATDPQYWVRHLRSTVRFAQGVQQLVHDKNNLFVEVGPSQVLAGLTRLSAPSTTKVFASLRHPTDDDSDQRQIFTALGNLWAAGVDVDWRSFSKHEVRRPLSLPTYPFERKRYWIETKPQNKHIASAKLERSDINDWFYVPSWKRSSIDRTSLKCALNERAAWLLFLDPFGLGESIARQLRKLGQIVTKVSIGNSFSQSEDGNFVMNPGNPGDYEKLFEGIKSIGRDPSKIVHFWSVTSSKASRKPPLDQTLNLGFHSLLQISQMLRRFMASLRVDVKVVSNELQEVTGEETLCAEKSLILGPCRVIPQEYPSVQCSTIDVVVPDGRKRDKFNELLLDELFAQSKELVVAHRGEHRWVQFFESERIHSAVDEQPKFRQGGVYLVTGGFGGIGYEVSLHLAKIAKAKLILVGRSPMPEREEWSSWKTQHPADDPVTRRIEQVETLEANGAEVMCVSANVVDEKSLKSAIDRAQLRFGKIHGVIHAAGVPGGGVIELKSRDAACRVLEPKVNGTIALRNALGNQELDFFALCSSINAVIGGVGQVDYCAANCFLDYFAREHRSHNVVSINWYAWREVGMAVNVQVPLSIKGERESILRRGIGTKEGLEVFTRILNSGTSNVVVSPEPLSNFRDQTHGGSVTQNHQAVLNPDSTRKLETRSSVEQTLVEIWKSVLGVEHVGLQDDFFQLGGHSLIGLNLFSEIKRRIGKDVPLSALFDAPTIEKMAALLKGDSPASELQKRSQIVVSIKPGGTRVPFFCIHGVGGAVIEYSHLARYLSPEQPFYGIQAQGLDGKEPWLKTIDDMAERYLREIKLIQPTGPYRLGGSSFGGIVAFEIAQRLRKMGEAVGLLAFFDSYGKDYPTALPTGSRVATYMNRTLARVDMHATNLRLLELREWPNYVREKANRIPVRAARSLKAMKKEVRFLFLPRALRNQFRWTGDDGGNLWKFNLPESYSAVADQNFKSTFGYKFEPYAGDAVLFWATKQQKGIQQDNTNGWGKLIQGNLRIIDVPGYHGAIIREPLVRNLAPKLDELLR